MLPAKWYCEFNSDPTLAGCHLGDHIQKWGFKSDEEAMASFSGPLFGENELDEDSDPNEEDGYCAGCFELL